MYTKILFLVSLLSVSAWAGNEETGGGSTGGANSVKHNILEYYSKDSVPVKGLELCQKKMRFLEATVPVFGKFVRENSERMTWYVVPARLESVPKEKVNAPLDTYQMAVQNHIEVFFDQGEVEKSTVESVARACMHESIMGLLKDKESDRVRALTAKIFETNPSVKSLQEMLLNLGFGPYMTYEQMDVVRRLHQKDYNDYLISLLDGANSACGDKKSLAEIGEKLSGKNEWGKRGNPFSFSSINGYLFTLMDFDNTYKKETQEKIANLKTLPDVGSYRYEVDLLVQACNHFDSWEKMNRTLCSFYYGFQNKNGPKELKDSYYGKNESLDDVAASALQLELGNYYAKDRLDLLASLTQQNDFLNIMATQYGNEWRSPDAFPCNYAPRLCGEDSVAKLKKLESKVNGKRKELARLEPQEKRSLLCNSVRALKKGLSKMKDRPLPPSSGAGVIYDTHYLMQDLSNPEVPKDGAASGN